MRLRWLIKNEGQKVLQYQQQVMTLNPDGTYTHSLVWEDVPIEAELTSELSSDSEQEP